MAELNMTTSAVTGFASSGSWFGLVFVIGFATIMLTFLIVLMSSFEFYVRARRLSEFIKNSFRYFLWGLFGIVLLIIPLSIFYYFYRQASEGNVVPIWVTLSMIAGYGIISLIGYFFKDFIWERIKFFEIRFREIEEINEENEKSD